jgi:hypothetical protein
LTTKLKRCQDAAQGLTDDSPMSGWVNLANLFTSLRLESAGNEEFADMAVSTSTCWVWMI